MPGRIEDHALISDLQTCALVDRDGAIDWLCLPRFDSGAAFASLVGSPDNGLWRLAPAVGGAATRRRYRGDTLILEQEWDVEGGSVRVTDFMPTRGRAPDVVRVVEGLAGRVDVRSELRLRFDYGRTVPWVRQVDGALVAVAGPDLVALRGPVPHEGRDHTSVAELTVAAGDRHAFVLTWQQSHLQLEDPVDADVAEREVERFWTDWIARCTYEGEWRDAVTRSLLTLKAMTYEPTGGMVAAATTSLPEQLGGARNWDYRYTWLRDATFTLQALASSGMTAEAVAWRDWLLRAIAGAPADVQIMYGVAGERLLPEWELPWLGGYEGSRPVRVGNGAVEQRQLDVFGEVMDALAVARRSVDATDTSWDVQEVLLEHLEGAWRDPDEGIWEVRGGSRQFTHSKVMAWVAFDRAARAVRESGLPGDARRWQAQADAVHREVCEQGWNPGRGSFTQAFGGTALDASLLLIPQVGFLPASDERVRGTVLAVQRELVQDGLVLRYLPTDGVDGLQGEEGTFLMCSFWLADCLALIGRHGEARELFERLLDLRNDVGLLAEEYDPRARRMLGNFPQAFSHVALVNTAHHLTDVDGTGSHRWSL